MIFVFKKTKQKKKKKKKKKKTTKKQKNKTKTNKKQNKTKHQKKQQQKKQNKTQFDRKTIYLIVRVPVWDHCIRETMLACKRVSLTFRFTWYWIRCITPYNTAIFKMETSLAQSQTGSYFPTKWQNGYPKTKKCKRHTHIQKRTITKIKHDRKTALERSVKTISLWSLI